jgi:carbon-monoxide dehydrogenase small subunit
METVQVSFRINDETTTLQVKSNETLLETLRERLALTGAKEACDEGSCGSCTVEVNGKPLRSCIALTVEMAGADIKTIEGIGWEGNLHPLQKTFMEEGAVQCGFCTSGMIMTAKTFLDRNSQPTKKEIITAISSNICRCTGYKKIVTAVEQAGKKGM